MYNVNCFIKRRLTGFFPFLILFLLSNTNAAFAEGSNELSANGGNRAFLVSGTTVTSSFTFPTLGTMKVYAKAGETINVGSSAQGFGFGTINLRSPAGTFFTSGTSATIGLIANRSQEVAGPLPNAGGYTPYTHVVTAAEEGIWEVDFIAQNNGAVGGENPVPIAANANWTQFTGQYIAAFDVAVRNVANTAFIPGRVYTNIFSGILGTYDVGFNGIFKVLTKDGYQYSLDNNGQAGNGFSFFVNNKGFRQADGTPLYQSINDLTNPNIQDPRVADTQTDITYKMFFNTPATDMPTSAPTPGSATTWLLNPIVNPALTNTLFTGVEGTVGKGGTSPLGGNFTFTTNKSGTFLVSVDVNNNGLYTDAIDRKIIGTVTVGTNTVTWDGLDGLGNKAPAGNYNANVSVVLLGGEVHFPFFDVERNISGIKLTRNNGPLAPDFTVYWDDSQITVVGTPSNPIKNLTGINSQINGHIWGTAGATPIDFGNDRGMDTWSFIASTPLSAVVTLQLREADLEVTGITASNVSGCVGQPVSYTVAVRNNGPNDVTGSQFGFFFPAALTGVTVTHVATSGISAVTTETVGTASYLAGLNLASGAVTTFTINGVVGAGATTVSVSASILRTADFTDPDATNPDGAPPTDPLKECDSAPSGTGCNNVKTNTVTFLARPDAGPDQSVTQKTVVTLTANMAGTWNQIGTTPALVTITTPASASTTVTGLNDIGKYQFQFTNANGCMDTVAVTVVPDHLDIPTIVTPNNDGQNDTFVIPNIDSFPGSTLLIINRWGNEVYRSTGYQNNWKGDGLPEGTYYYVLNKKEISGSITTYKGWIFLKR